jgi:pyruvate dehydrogenase (quinone)
LPCCSASGPALVDVRTARQELALPPKLTYGQIKGFTLYATRTILSGGGGELVELTKTNLRDLAAPRTSTGRDPASTSPR